MTATTFMREQADKQRATLEEMKTESAPPAGNTSTATASPTVIPDPQPVPSESQRTPPRV